MRWWFPASAIRSQPRFPAHKAVHYAALRAKGKAAPYPRVAAASGSGSDGLGSGGGWGPGRQRSKAGLEGGKGRGVIGARAKVEGGEGGGEWAGMELASSLEGSEDADLKTGHGGGRREGGEQAE